MSGRRFGVGVNPREEDTVFNVSLSDPRIEEAGLNPSDFLGKGLSEEELVRRLAIKKEKGKVVSSLAQPRKVKKEED